MLLEGPLTNFDKNGEPSGDVVGEEVVNKAYLEGVAEDRGDVELTGKVVDRVAGESEATHRVAMDLGEDVAEPYDVAQAMVENYEPCPSVASDSNRFMLDLVP